MNKYIARKLVFILVLVALIAAPFGIQAHQSANTTDPFILMARYIERLSSPGGVDVLNIIEDGPRGTQLLIMTYIEDFPNWSVRQDQENFKRDVVAMVSDYGYETVIVFLGWDYPPPAFRVQGSWNCQELRAGSCEWEVQPSVVIGAQHIKWQGIGKP